MYFLLDSRSFFFSHLSCLLTKRRYRKKQHLKLLFFFKKKNTTRIWDVKKKNKTCKPRFLLCCLKSTTEHDLQHSLYHFLLWNTDSSNCSAGRSYRSNIPQSSATKEMSIKEITFLANIYWLASSLPMIRNILISKKNCNKCKVLFNTTLSHILRKYNWSENISKFSYNAQTAFTMKIPQNYLNLFLCRDFTSESYTALL